MIALQSMGLIFFVYFIPAVAFFPRLLFSPYLAFSIPIVSAWIGYCLTSFLQFFFLFSTWNVRCILFAFFVIFLLRLPKVWKQEKGWSAWFPSARRLYFFHFLFCLPFWAKLMTHGFDRGDELYSWNYWAIQHYFQETIDFSHTGATYPQLFPKLLALGYQWLGSFDLQLPVKGGLVVFPFALLNAIAFSCPMYVRKYIGMHCITLFYVFFGLGYFHFLKDGYADPLMTSGLIVSAALFFQGRYLRTGTSKNQLWGIAVCAGMMCAYSKQPGFIWLMFSFPGLFFLEYLRERKTICLFFIGICLLTGAVWLFTEGHGFYNNQGVLVLSLEDRNVFSQLCFSLNKYFLQRPLLFIFFLLALVASFFNRLLKQMWCWFMLPSILCWLLFGAYQLRLGQHLIMFAFFTLSASRYCFFTQYHCQRFVRFIIQYQKGLLRWGCGISIGVTLWVLGTAVQQTEAPFSEGGRLCLYRYFGKEAQAIYTHIYSHPDLVLWVPSRYVYGLFYKRTQLLTPDYLAFPLYDKRALISELKQKRPDFVFTVDKSIEGGEASSLLKEVIHSCPSAFQLFTEAQNKYSFKAYKINKIALETDLCLESLQSVAFSA